MERVSRRELLAMIAQQQATISQQAATISQQEATIGQLQQRIDGLETRLNSRGGEGMPGNKPPSAKRTLRKTGRKRRAHGFGRVRMAPTEQVEHAVASCGDCGTALVGGWIQRKREVIEIPLTPVQVVEHAYIARECPLCGKRWIPGVELAGVVVGRQRFGIGLVSLLTTLREEGRLPFRTIQWLLRMVYQLRLSVGAIVEAIHRTAKEAEQTVGQVREHIRASPVVYADETGWREDGSNGYVWTFSTPSERYFLRRGRKKEVVDEVLGSSFSGVLVSDFYAAYNHYPGLHQRCWAHLLRDIHNLKELYPDDTGLSAWAADLHKLYQQAKAFSSPDERQRGRLQLEMEEKLLALCRPFLDDPLAVQRKLCRRMQRFIKELFVFVGDPMVQAENNAAERSLRHLVTSRKISGGTRSQQGTNSKMSLASLFGTWRAGGLNPFLECRKLLASPQM